MTKELEAQLTAVAGARALYAQAIDERTAAEAAMDKTPEWGEYIAAGGRLRQVKQIVDAAESAAKEAIIAHYEDTKDKKPVAGAQVKLYDTLSYPPDVALLWAMDKRMETVLRLNKRPFEAVIKTVKPKFLTIEKKPRAQLARDLSSYIQEDVEK